MKLDGKTIYAQSSDIKSRTYLEYRKDMKKKAIAELEVLGWLESKVKQLYPNKKVKVYKSGGDKFLWFLRKGGVSREPDFIAEIGDEKIEFEFQYVNADLNNFYFNFKTSKLLKKRQPQKTQFLCMLSESPTKYVILNSEWILKNSYKTTEAAWGSREVQGVIDENKIVKIIPRDLDSFFKVCFILDNINKIPQNANLWLIYLLSYIREGIILEDISKIVYCVDFLYSKIELKPNELAQLLNEIKELLIMVKGFYKEDGSYRSSLKASPLEETRYALFSINLLEDLIQDLIFYYSVAELKPIKKIFENIGSVEKTYNLLKGEIKDA